MFSLQALCDALPEATFLRTPSHMSSTRWTPHIDSRGVLPTNALFIALRGERFDGHDFIKDVVSRGVKAVCVEDARAASHHPELDLVIVVEDSLQALQALASSWRATQPARCVGITGSLGKTIVKEMLGAMLSQRFTIHRSPGSYNSQIGVPLSLLGIRPTHQIALIEVGISRPGEMARHAQMIRPDFGVLTSISVAHPAELPTEELTLKEKMLLFEDLHYPANAPIRWTSINRGERTSGKAAATAGL